MAKISAYMMCGLNGEISRNGPLVQFKEMDIHFRKTTEKKSILMGSKTFESCKIPLKGRTVFVLSSQNKTFKDATLVHTVDEFLELTKDEDEIIICGGAKVYELTKLLWEQVYFNVINMGFHDADNYFRSYTSKWDDGVAPTIIEGKNGLYAKCHIFNQYVPEVGLTMGDRYE